MFPGSGQFDDPLTPPAALISPRDRTLTPFSCWERGGDALGDPGNGVNTTNWQYVCDPETGDVTVTPDSGAAQAVYTIAPLPVEFTGSFGVLDMEPVIAWRDVDGDSFIRYFDGADFVVEQLPNCSYLHLAIDDVRDAKVAAGTSDTILAYVYNDTVFYRLSRDDYAVEYEDEFAFGFFTLSRIGMNTEFRFQFERNKPQPEGTPSLSYKEIDQRTEQLVGFDDDGAAAFYTIVTDGEVGITGPTSFVTKYTGDAPFFFLRPPTGVGWVNTSVEINLDFYISGGRRRSRLFLTYVVDIYGNITLDSKFAGGEAVVRLVEAGVGTQTYTVTAYLPESGFGVTLHLIALGSVPSIGTFLPLWNEDDDFTGGGFTPSGLIRYAHYGSWVALNTVAATGYDGRSTSTRLRWAAGSVPASLRPSADRVVPCYVALDGDTVAGQAQLNTDGSAEFWPLTTSSTRLIRGAFAASTTVDRTKGLPASWQLIYGLPPAA